MLNERSDLALEIPVEDLGSVHSLVDGHAGDVPSTEDKVAGVNHRKDCEQNDQHTMLTAYKCV